MLRSTKNQLLNMLSRFSVLLSVTILLFSSTGSFAGDNDYLRHNKFFYLCSFKRECTNCSECGKDRYNVKIQNRVDKKIKSVSYTFYSSVYNKLLTKDAVIEGQRIDPRAIGILYICSPEGLHWCISEIMYADGTSEHFTLHDRMETFLQEPDECDCND